MECIELLTHRETEVMQKLIGGYNSREIATDMNISEFTVRAHRRRIMEKTGCKNSAQLYSYFILKNQFTYI
jgi:DNA-binding CsgD family transcriptional regulator